MTEPHRIPLWERASGAIVDALLHEHVDSAFGRRADSQWQTYLTLARSLAIAQGGTVPTLEHELWRWERIISRYEQLLAFPVVGIEYADEVQGLVVLGTSGYHCRKPGHLDVPMLDKPLVNVKFLATAPWNLKKVVATPRFKGVGTVLMRVAVEASYDLGFKGRVGLHSLPGAEEFYQSIGMECLGLDAAQRGLPYYEMSSESADDFIKEVMP